MAAKQPEGVPTAVLDAREARTGEKELSRLSATTPPRLAALGTPLKGEATRVLRKTAIRAPPRLASSEDAVYALFALFEDRSDHA